MSRIFHLTHMFALTLLCVLTMSSTASATTCVSFAAFPNSNLSTIRLKLTFVGETERSVQSSGFAVTGQNFDVQVFTPCKKSDVSYGGDTLTLNLGSILPSEMSDILTRVSSLPAVQAGGVATQGYLSFSLYDSLSDTGFEVVLDKTDGSSVLQALRLALSGNANALKIVDQFGCVTDLKEPGTPADVTSSVQVALSGIRLNRATGRFVGIATVKNNSASPVPGPLSVLFDFNGSVALYNPTGLTCAISPVNRGYLNLPGSSLGPGQSITLTLDIENPIAEPVLPSIRVFSGPGAR